MWTRSGSHLEVRPANPPCPPLPPQPSLHCPTPHGPPSSSDCSPPWQGGPGGPGGRGIARQAQRGGWATPTEPLPLLPVPACRGGLRNQPQQLHFSLQGLSQTSASGGWEKGGGRGDGGWGPAPLPFLCASPPRATGTLSARSRVRAFQEEVQSLPSCHRVGQAGWSSPVGSQGPRAASAFLPLEDCPHQQCLLSNKGLLTPLQHLGGRRLVGRDGVARTIGPGKAPLGVWRLGCWA